MRYEQGSRVCTHRQLGYSESGKQFTVADDALVALNTHAMKFLAFERPVVGAASEAMHVLLKAEARRLWELHRAGVVREAYFTPAHDAVLVLECADESAATEALNTLPLVREKQIRFEITALLPYTGFERLFTP